MGLRVWDLSSDSYDHTQLANNWLAVDTHDHTTGKGLQIPSGGLADGSITTAKLADNSVTGPKILDGSVTGSKFPDGAITNAKIADFAVTSGKIIDGAISTAKLLDLSVTTPKLADSAVTGPKIANNSIDASKLANGSVGTLQLADTAVTAAKLSDNAVIQSKVADAAIGTAEIINGNVTRAKLDPSVEPVGIVIQWYRPNASTSVPTGWIFCDGRSLTAAEHDFGGGGTIAIPDLRNRFVLGADTAGTGGGTGTPPSIGLAGGSHTRDSSHSHTIAAHSHQADDHIHAMAADGFHGHTFQGGLALHSRRNAPVTKTGTGAALAFVGTDNNTRTFSLQSVYLAGFNAQPSGEFDDAFGMDGNGSHSHGGATGIAGGTIPTTTVGVVTTSGALANADSRPAYVGLLFLIKVKAS